MTISSLGASLNADPFARAASAAASVRERLDLLTRQAGDGLRSDTFGGLDARAGTAMTLGASLSQIQTWQKNIDDATGRMSVTQTALQQISSIADDFFAKSATLNALSGASVDTIAASARDALTQVASLLNSKFGNIYVFAGTDSATPPIPSPDLIGQSGLVTGIGTAVAQLATNGAAATIGTTLALAASDAPGITPFSPGISQPAAAIAGMLPAVEVGQNDYATVGIVASANAAVPSTGTSTTGSYMRDILRALATLGSLSSTQVTAPGFMQLVQDVHTSLGDAIGALNADAGVLGNRQDGLTRLRQHLDDVSTATQGQISNIQNVDMADTLTQLSASQTQLQASYQLLASLRSLSLARYIGLSG